MLCHVFRKREGFRRSNERKALIHPWQCQSEIQKPTVEKGLFLKKIKPNTKLVLFNFLHILSAHFCDTFHHYVHYGAKENKVIFLVWHGMDNAYFPYNFSFPCACWKLFFIVRKSKACLHWNTGKAKAECWCVSHSDFFLAFAVKW